MLGNMNNNNFSLMRYFRDIGIDAHLLLSSNDGVSISSHFKPDSDTFEINKWKPFIHQTKISENIVSSFNFPTSWSLSLRSFYRSKKNKKNLFYAPISKNYLRNLFKGYTHFIGSGIYPSVLKRINGSLDIFYPYALGVEYYDNQELKSLINQKGIFAKYIFSKVKKKQCNGIKKAKLIINTDPSSSLKAFKKIGVDPITMFVPMIYNKEVVNKNLIDDKICKILEKIKKVSFSILSHSRLLWKKPSYFSDAEWIYQNKNNDRFIRAFARLKKHINNFDLLLILFEYGDDVEITKKLINELGITKNVLWLPKMERKNIFKILQEVDVGIGEFYDVLNVPFGGTALEIMAAGKPLIQTLDFSKDQYFKTYNIPMPPVLAARTEKEIFSSILSMIEDGELKLKIGKLSKKWFNDYQGIELAKKWASLLEAKS